MPTAALLPSPAQAAAVDARNAKTVSQHVSCASFEVPVRCPCRDEEGFFGSGLGAALDDLRSRGLVGAADPTLVFKSLPAGAPAAGAFGPGSAGGGRGGGQGAVRAWRYCGPPFRGAGPAGGISLRAIEDERYQARCAVTLSRDDILLPATSTLLTTHIREVTAKLLTRGGPLIIAHHCRWLRIPRGR